MRFIGAIVAFLIGMFARRRQRKLLDLATKVREIPERLAEAGAPRIKYQAALRHVLNAQWARLRMDCNARKAERRAAR